MLISASFIHNLHKRRVLAVYNPILWKTFSPTFLCTFPQINMVSKTYPHSFFSLLITSSNPFAINVSIGYYRVDNLSENSLINRNNHAVENPFLDMCISPLFLSSGVEKYFFLTFFNLICGKLLQSVLF